MGIPIANTPGMFGAEVADLAMCYVLGLARDAFLVDREVRAGNWVKPSGISTAGKTMGIIGLGYRTQYCRSEPNLMICIL